jgi:hypothetical protein
MLSLGELKCQLAVDRSRELGVVQRKSFGKATSVLGLGALEYVVVPFTRPLAGGKREKVSTFQSLTMADGAELLRRWKLPNTRSERGRHRWPS